VGQTGKRGKLKMLYKAHNGKQSREDLCRKGLGDILGGDEWGGSGGNGRHIRLELGVVESLKRNHDRLEGEGGRGKLSVAKV